MENKNKNNNTNKKGKKGCLFSFLILLIIVLGVIFIIYKSISPSDKSFIIQENLEDPLLSYDNLIASLSEDELDLDFDNDGLTNREEISLQTDIFNPDTDGDGIYDGTEVKMYNTNPLKYSTADDGISDMAKIDAGLDPFSKHTEKSEKQTIEVENTSVSITTNDLNSLSSYVIKEVSINKIDEEILSVPIKVSDFKGTVNIPITVHSDNAKVYYYNEYTSEKIEIKDAKFKDNIVEVKINEENVLPIVVLNSSNDDDSNNNSNLENLQGKYTIVDCNLYGKTRMFANFLGIEIADDTDTLVIFRLGDKKSQITVEDIKTVYSVPEGYELFYEETNIELVYTTIISIIKKILFWIGGEEYSDGGISNLYFSIKEYEGDLLSILNSLTIDLDSNQGSYGDDIEDTRESLFGKTYNAKTSFLAGRDDFSIKNFGILNGNTGGQCAGYSLLTSLIFNGQGSDIPRSNQYNEYSYDLSYPYFDDLFLKGNLFKYKVLTEKVLIENGGSSSYLYDLDSMNKNESELLKFINLYWALFNDSIHKDSKNIQLDIVGNRGVLAMDFTGRNSNIINMANTIEQRVNNDEITSTAMVTSKNGGHAVNIIGIKTSSYDPNTIELEVYDNNYPNNWYYPNNGSEGKYVGDRVFIRLILKEEKKNIMGVKQNVISEHFYYNTKEGYKEDLSQYNEQGYTNIDIGTINFYGNYMAIYDESKVGIK